MNYRLDEANKMKKLLVIIEIITIIVAVIFGILWIKTPTGYFEPIIGLSSTISIIIELIRRYIPADNTKDQTVPDNPSDLRQWLIKNIYDLDLSRALQLTIIFAQKSENNELEKWARLELNGWLKENGMEKSDMVPEYRTVGGQHMDEFGRPLIISDPKLDFINETRLRHSVKELESLAKENKMVFIRDITANHLIKENLGAEVTKFVFNTSSVAGVLENIRTNLLKHLNSQ